MATSNPAVSMTEWPRAGGGEKTATVQGTAFKALILTAIMCVTGFHTWTLATEGYAETFSQHVKHKHPGDPTRIEIPDKVIGLAAVGVIGGFLAALACIFAPQASPVLAPIYAGLEGLALGAVSAGFEAKYPGIVPEAMVGVLTILVCMLALYTTGILRPTEGFIAGVLAAMGGILAIYFANIIFGFFGGKIGFVDGGGWAGIVFSGIVVVVASLNFIIDFGEIADNVERGAPKYMEWYGAFGIMLTVVWLYLEMLRLLAKLKGDSDSSDD